MYAKNVISNTDYYLISMADEIYIPEMTDVWLKGLSMNISFFRSRIIKYNTKLPNIFSYITNKKMLWKIKYRKP